MDDTYKFLAPKSDDCSLDIFTHFKSYKEECVFDNTLVDLKVSTDKLVYSEDDMIKVVFLAQSYTLFMLLLRNIMELFCSSRR